MKTVREILDIAVHQMRMRSELRSDLFERVGTIRDIPDGAMKEVTSYNPFLSSIVAVFVSPDGNVFVAVSGAEGWDLYKWRR